MPDIEIKNETEDVLRMSLTFGVQLFCENVEAGNVFKVHVPSLPYIFEACLLKNDNINDAKAGVAAITAAVCAGTASVILGSMWAVGVFGRYSSPSGRFARDTAGGLMRSAHAAGATFAAPVDGVVVRKDGLLIGFQNLTFAVRMVEGKHELVHL